MANEIDHNVFVRRSNETGPEGLIVWCPAENENCRVHLDSPAALHRLTGTFAAHDQFLSGYLGPLFKGAQLSRYELVAGFPAAKSTYRLPERIREALGWERAEMHSPGAYRVSD
jgi:hypothetical protein